MRRTIILALGLGLLAVLPVTALAAHTGANYKGKTTQGKAVSFDLDKNGGSKMLTAFRIRFDAPCDGGFVYHSQATLFTVDVDHGRFSGDERNVEGTAGTGRIAKINLTLHGAFAKGGKRSTGRWHAKVRIETLKGGNLVTRCHTGLVHWTAKRTSVSAVK